MRDVLRPRRVLALLPMLACLRLAHAADAEAWFHVSVVGNDAWSGRLAEPNAAKDDGPFATIDRARRAVRETPMRETPVELRVSVHAGTYRLVEPLRFLPEDSIGTKVIYEAAPGVRPVIDGGIRIAGWKRGDGGIWQATVPEVAAGKLYPHELFVNGIRRPRARLPKSGCFTIAALPELDPKAPYDTSSDSFQFAEGDLRPDWTGIQDIEVVVPHFWTDSHLGIASIDAGSRTVRFRQKSGRRFTDDHTHMPGRYWIENVAEALTDPGEWHLDRVTGIVRYLPMPGEDMTTSDAWMPALSCLASFDGRPGKGELVSGVELRGLAFQHAEWQLPANQAGDSQSAAMVPGAIRFTGAIDCAVTDCVISHCGTYGIEVGSGCHDIRLVGNECADLGAGGLIIGGADAKSPDALRTSRITATDNRLHHLGEIHRSGAGILSMHAAECVYAHNLIHHLYYTGISVGWVWGYAPNASHGNLIAENDIHDVGQGLLSDMGGIYTLGVQPGTVIRGNRIHDVDSHGYGGWGIYTDEGSSDIVIERNLVYRTKSGGFHQHYGRDNVVRNNIFAYGREFQIRRSKEEPHQSFAFVRNIVLWNSGALLDGTWNDGHFLLDLNCYGFSGDPSGEVRFSKGPFMPWQAAGNDPHSLLADPCFVDPANGDFTLLPGSPALGLGFEPLEMAGVGPRSR